MADEPFMTTGTTLASGPTVLLIVAAGHLA